MLQDRERKLLRILWNLNQMEWAKNDFTIVCRLTGWSSKEIEVLLDHLIDDKYIERDEGNHFIRVIEGWDRSKE